MSDDEVDGTFGPCLPGAAELFISGETPRHEETVEAMAVEPWAWPPAFEEPRDGELDDEPDEPCLRVRGFTSNWDERHLRILFMLHGKVSSLRIVPDAAYGRAAYVSLDNAQVCEAAAEQLHNRVMGGGTGGEECLILCAALLGKAERRRLEAEAEVALTEACSSLVGQVVSELASWSVRQLRDYLRDRREDHTHCFEKCDLVERVAVVIARRRRLEAAVAMAADANLSKSQRRIAATMLGIERRRQEPRWRNAEVAAMNRAALEAEAWDREIAEAARRLQETQARELEAMAMAEYESSRRERDDELQALEAARRRRAEEEEMRREEERRKECGAMADEERLSTAEELRYREDLRRLAEEQRRKKEEALRLKRDRAEKKRVEEQERRRLQEEEELRQIAQAQSRKALIMERRRQDEEEEERLAMEARKKREDQLRLAKVADLERRRKAKEAELERRRLAKEAAIERERLRKAREEEAVALRKYTEELRQKQDEERRLQALKAKELDVVVLDDDEQEAKHPGTAAEIIAKPASKGGDDEKQETKELVHRKMRQQSGAETGDKVEMQRADAPAETPHQTERHLGNTASTRKEPSPRRRQTTHKKGRSPPGDKENGSKHVKDALLAARDSDDGTKKGSGEKTVETALHEKGENNSGSATAESRAHEKASTKKAVEARRPAFELASKFDNKNKREARSAPGEARKGAKDKKSAQAAKAHKENGNTTEGSRDGHDKKRKSKASLKKAKRDRSTSEVSEFTRVRKNDRKRGRERSYERSRRRTRESSSMERPREKASKRHKDR